MKNFLLIVLVFMFAFISCFRKKDNRNTEALENSTPEVLDESENYISKRYKSDIIEELFKEAQEKDIELKSLVDKNKGLGNWERDKLEAYEKFTSNNSEFWNSSRYLLDGIKDSSLKKQYKKIFADLKSKQLQISSEIDTASSTLNKKKQLFNDYFILVKLMVTQKMMLNYWQNELPEVKPINEVIDEFDSLINVSKLIIEKQ